MGNEFASLTQLGDLFGVSSHVVGDWLVEIGLRTPQKKPSPRAFAEKYCDQQPNGTGYFWIWDKDKTLAALVAAGHRRLDQLVGPFEYQLGKKRKYEIVDANGTVGISVGAENYARLITWLLNQVHQRGKLPN